MNHKVLLPFSILVLPTLALAQGATSYTCTMDGQQRRVVILTEPGVTVPCEVQYHKDTEAPGEVEVLWRAATQADYCQTKADEFVAKLGNLGWNCTDSDASVSEAAEADAPADDAATDDTAALEPAD